MRKLIDLEAAIEVIRFDSGRIPDDLDSKQATVYCNGLYAAINIISSCPAIEAVPVVHGRCKFCEDYDKFMEIVCYLPTENGGSTPVPLNHCPNCGSRMDGD